MSILDIPIVEIVFITFAFIFGSCVGSFLNVVVARLPLEKSLIWPGSRCGSCYRPIRFFFDNLPIVSYLILRGRCRKCGARFSCRYFWVELSTGAAFAALFYLDIFKNWQQHPYIAQVQVDIFRGTAPLKTLLKAWMFFAYHATLMSFFIAAALCDLERKTIPISLTVFGTVVGLVLSTLFPWPWPNEVQRGVLPADTPWYFEEFIGKIPRGICPWPVWGPLPNWLPPGSPQLGFLTSLAGAAAGTFMIRFIKWVFETGLEREALGLGDADFMMMVGAFTGWQIVLIGFFAGTFVALLGVILQALFRVLIPRRPTEEQGDRAIPFGPGLAIGSFLILMAWPEVGPRFQLYLFEPIVLFAGATIVLGGLFVSSLLLRQRTVEEKKAA